MKAIPIDISKIDKLETLINQLRILFDVDPDASYDLLHDGKMKPVLVISLNVVRGEQE